MAKLVQENILVTLSRVAKDGDAATGAGLSADQISQIEQLVEELVGAGVVVEVQPIPDA